MAGIKLFVWNDDDDKLRTWIDAAVSDGIGKDDIQKCCSRDAAVVVQEWTKSEADVVLLDVMLEGRQPFGLTVAKRIHDLDPLVPIMGVTAYPDQVYNAYMDEASAQHARLAGIYHQSALKKGLFVDFALRETLQRWHTSCKQVALLRRCVRSLQAEMQTRDDGAASRGLRVLIEALRQLAFERSVDIWHEQLSSKVQQLLRDAECESLAASFGSVADLFRKADRFHMAVGRGRRHLAHNVQVFAAGIPCLLAEGDLRRHAEESIADLFPGCTRKDRGYLAVLLWACASMTHDVAYIGETFSDVCRDLCAVAREMELKRATMDLCGGDGVGVPTGVEESHAALGAKLWRRRFANCKAGSTSEPSKGEADAAEIIASAIESHHGGARGSAKIESRDWMSFLAVMCDEIQDWHRERHEEEILWEFFELERYGISSSAKRTNVELEFVAQDIPLVAAWVKGMPPRAEVEARLDQIKRQLEERLDYGGKMHVLMRACFPLRNALPAEKKATF